MYKFYYTIGYGVTYHVRNAITSIWQIAWSPNIKRWFMRINLTCLMLLIAFLQITLAASAQKISLNKKNATLTDVFKELKKQSGYGFMISKERIKIAKQVTINVSGDELIEVLDQCFKDQPFGYRIEDKMIIVIDKKPEPVKTSYLEIDVKGRILDENGEPLVGASISIKGTARRTTTNDKGEFSFTNVDEKAVLVISFVGYEAKEVAVKADLGAIRMAVSTGELEEVKINYNTGYQELPKERATGSFVHLNKELIDRRVSTSILDRIEDVTSGLIFNRTASNSDPISIRGRSTLFGNTRPLIVIDNLPYEGDINNINPNDVESITVLKDAAAASIWGAQAGNGVIVITTKSGRYNRSTRVSLQSNLNIVEKPDLFYAPQMEIPDFIEQERKLFQSGYYNSSIASSARSPLSPVVETLLAVREGRISQQEGEERISQYKTQDFRNDLNKYYYRPSIRQQHAFQVDGGGKAYRFNYSGGYDQSLDNQIGNETSRITLNARQDWKLLRDRLTISTGLALARATGFSNTGLPTSPYPYQSLSDSEGNPLSVVAGLNTRFIESTIGSELLDWRSIPLAEIGKRNDRSVSMDIRTNLGLKYQVLRGLDANIQYQYWRNGNENRNIETEDLWVVRHQINSYTQVRPDGSFSLPIPRGSRFTDLDAVSQSHNLRTNLAYAWHKGPNEINAIGGWELRDQQGYSDRMVYYGYDDAIGISAPVDFITRFSQYQNRGSQLSIPYGGQHTGVIDRYLSYFANLGYSYQGKYLVNASARKDMSNLFGVETNQRGVPLWSAGVGWILSEEEFYGWKGMRFLKLRASYGYNGNVDKTTTAFTTVQYSNANSSDYVPGLRYAFVSNPPNPNLRWERIKIVNLGLDFETKNRRLGGSLEVYSKVGEDLIGESQVPGSNGTYQYRGNFSGTMTKGFDLTMNTINIQNSLVWSTQWLLSGVKDKVTYFDGSRSASQLLASQSNMVPLEGKPLFSIYSYAWGGLDPANGNPLGYLDSELSDNYAKILSSATPENLQFHGSARPTIFGSIRNSLDWKGWNLSFNITYRLDYYFRRLSVDYSALSRGQVTHSDYTNRWKNPGDELSTNIPSQPVNLNTQRHSFYQGSSVLVEKGDNIRLQDVRFGYTWTNNLNTRAPFKSLEFFTYLNNLGILWKATDLDIDPDFRTMKPQRSVALGLRVNF